MPASSIPALSGLRAAVGVGAWVTPNVSGRLFGLDPVNNPQASYVGRLFGARDLALAAGTLTTEGEARRRWIQLGLAWSFRGGDTTVVALALALVSLVVIVGVLHPASLAHLDGTPDPEV